MAPQRVFNLCSLVEFPECGKTYEVPRQGCGEVLPKREKVG